MTLLASERSLLIRNKFRTVLQLRIQNRRLSEINTDSGLKSACPQKPEKNPSDAQRLNEDGTTPKLPPGGLNAETAQERTACGTQRQRKARPAQDLTEKGHRGPVEQQPERKLNLQTSSASFPVDVLKDDISPAAKLHGAHQSPAVSSLPRLPVDQSSSDCSAVGLTLNNGSSHAQSGLTMLPATTGIRQPTSATLGESNSLATTGRPNGMYVTPQTAPLLPKRAQPPSPSSSSSLTPPLNLNHLPRPRKPRDIKPKMRKLKYHQYIPPYQKGASGPGVGGAKQSSPPPAQPLDPAYSHLLKQQQVFLQLQILQSQQQQLKPQQQLTAAPCGDNDHRGHVKSCGAASLSLHPAPAATSQTPTDIKPASKPELLPANLVDLTVSELRQQLRKRGLPVSGTKPTLLQRLRPFQLQHACPASTPPSKLGTGLGTLTLCPSLPSYQSPGSSPNFEQDSPGSGQNQQLYTQEGSIPSGIGHNGALTLNAAPNAASVCLTSTLFSVTASTASGTPSPSLPMSSSSPLQCVTPWRTDSEQQHMEEVEKRERKRSQLNACSVNDGSEEQGYSRRKPETNIQTEPLFTQACDVIDQDFELPLQITASPVQSFPGIRSLEEELQEAIQKAQMDPRQSIDDILAEALISDDSLEASNHKSPTHCPPDPSPSPQTEQSHSFQHEDNFLPSPLCSSLLLELPPSPAVISPNQVVPAPPPICTSPLPSSRKSRKRRLATTFDAADWLETLTSGLHPLTPPKAPFVESDFSLDSDLNVNRVLDLLIEQW